MSRTITGKEYRSKLMYKVTSKTKSPWENNDKKCSLMDFNILQEIGRGAYGVVFKV
jgi:hypothetical protein